MGRAKERTDKFRLLGYYDESSGIWSEIKEVYMRLQHGKCAYCERQLESEEYGTIEHDVEHFRPKKKTKSWKLPKTLQTSGISLTQPLNGTVDPGYHLLAYHPFNYCTSCKTCNSSLKSNYFPIEDQRLTDVDDPSNMGSEKPLLINPVGDFDDDPSTIITFHGLSPQSCGTNEYKYHRGLTVIEFFKLDDPKRKYLFRERANVIVSLYSFLQSAKNARNQSDRGVFNKLIDNYTKVSAPHSNCAKSFCTLYTTNENEAKDLFELAADYIDSISN